MQQRTVANIGFATLMLCAVGYGYAAQYVFPAKQAEFDKARAACLEGKGYTVK
jgi:hypothetical protein